MTDSGMGLDVMPEGTQRGTPRKRALFGPGCSHSMSPVSDVAEAGLGGRSRMRIRIWLVREISDSGPASGWAGFTSTTVPMFAGRTSWDQYRQVFEAIFRYNEWMV